MTVMTGIKENELMDLAEEFGNAATEFLEAHTEINIGDDDLVTDGEIARAREIGEEFDLVSDEDTVDCVIEQNESLASRMLRVMDIKDVAALVPEDKKSAAASNEFTGRGYRQLGNLFRPAKANM